MWFKACKIIAIQNNVRAVGEFRTSFQTDVQHIEAICIRLTLKCNFLSSQLNKVHTDFVINKK